MDMEKVIKEYEDYVNSYISLTTSHDYEFEMYKAVLALLKEQEPVEPIPYDLDTPVTTVMRCYKCGWCNADITAGNPYCWHCGRAVKWDD